MHQTEPPIQAFDTMIIILVLVLNEWIFVLLKEKEIRDLLETIEARH